MAKPLKSTRKAPPADGPRYRVLQKSYIDGRLVGPGTGDKDDPNDEIVYEGVPGKFLEPLNAAAEKAVEEAETARAKARKDAGMLPERQVGAALLTGKEGRGGKPTPAGPKVPA